MLAELAEWWRRRRTQRTWSRVLRGVKVDVLAVFFVGVDGACNFAFVLMFRRSEEEILDICYSCKRLNAI